MKLYDPFVPIRVPVGQAAREAESCSGRRGGEESSRSSEQAAVRSVVVPCLRSGRSTSTRARASSSRSPGFPKYTLVSFPFPSLHANVALRKKVEVLPRSRSPRQQEPGSPRIRDVVHRKPAGGRVCVWEKGKKEKKERRKKAGGTDKESQRARVRARGGKTDRLSERRRRSEAKRETGRVCGRLGSKVAGYVRGYLSGAVAARRRGRYLAGLGGGAITAISAAAPALYGKSRGGCSAGTGLVRPRASEPRRRRVVAVR